MLELAEWNPESALFYRWNYSWTELLKFINRKYKIYAERKRTDFDFLVKLAEWCFGGSSDESYDVDTGEGIEDMTEEQEAALRLALGEDFDKLYG